MHGIRKSSVRKHASEEEVLKMNQKIDLYEDMMAQIQKMKREEIYDQPTVLLVTSQMIQLNPDFQMLWNYRRQTIEFQIAQDPVVTPTLVQNELSLTKKALMRNPKSYPSWYQRQWILHRYASHVDFNQELDLCNQLLELDERNFHCWNYRRYVARVADVSQEKELTFSMHKIEHNFSNYSAFHFRALLLQHPSTKWDFDTLHRDDTSNHPWKQEIELIQQAVFTEPEDQSVWFYYKWLVQLALTYFSSNNSSESGTAMTIVESVLLEQMEWIEELVEMESDDSKWPLTLLLFLCQKLYHWTREEKYLEQGRGFGQKLIQVDSNHTEYYRDQMKHFTS